MSPDAVTPPRPPYPGLRAFEREESDLFFGREGTVNEMINRLRPNRFLAVLGTSGSGKSSLVKIGLLDGLELGLLSEAGSRWRIADFKPGADPLRNLARALAGLAGSDVDLDLLEAFLARGPRSVIEWCKDGHLPAGANLLLLVDQFEELFRYQDYTQRQAAEAFVALLIESARNREVPIYVVITMRSEYLGACALIEGLAEIINDGQFLTPRLNRDQCREAIVGPAAVCGIAIEDTLVNRLLNDIEDFAPWDDRDSADQLDRLVRRADQLPLLQHTLNRLWLRAYGSGGGKSGIELRLADYDAIGGLRGAINAHADEILARLGPGLQKRAEQVFRALTDGKSIATAVRRPTRFADLVAICDGDEAGTRAVVEAFVAPGVNFLRYDTVSLEPSSVVDISHESLIRQWRKLSGWLLEEAREAQEWMRLGEAATRYRAGAGSLFYGQDLYTWRNHARPTEAWARRYNQPYKETLAFLDESIRADSRGKRMRYAGIAATVAVIAGFGGGLFYFTQIQSRNAQLIEQAEALALQATLLQQNGLELIASNDRLSLAQGELEKSVERLQEARQQLRDVFLASFDASVGAYQHSDQWADAGALLGTMLSRTSHRAGDERMYDDSVVNAARMRLAGQWAFPVWPAIAPPSPVPHGQLLMQPPRRYSLSQASTGDPLRLFDLLSGAIVAEAPLPEGMALDTSAIDAIDPGGANVAFIDVDGNVVRWRTADGRFDTYGSLRARGGAVTAMAFDPVSGRIALLLFREDSELVVFDPAPEGRVVRAPLVGIDGLGVNPDAPDANSSARTLDGDGITFWSDNLVVVAFLEGSARRFAAVSLLTVAATRLPASLRAVLPSSDGAILFAADDAGCKNDPATFVILDGTLRDAADPAAACFGYIALPGDDDVVRLGAIGPTAAIVSADAAGTTADGDPRYRLVVDDRPSAGDRHALLAIDLVRHGESLAPVAAGEATDDAVPEPVGRGDEPAGFAAAFNVEAWQPRPDPAATKNLVWFDPVSETSVRLAELRLFPEGSMVPVEVRRTIGEWPSRLGALSGLGAAVGGDALLVVTGSQGGIRQLDSPVADLVLRELNVQRDCRFGSGETLAITRLLPWSVNTPTFLGLDSSGRVLRFSALFGGGASSGGLAVQVSCIGRLRPDFVPLAIADPAGERVLLQTDPLGFAILPANVETEKEFNEAPRIALSTPAYLAALVPGETPSLATVDRNGNLTVLAARADGCGAAAEGSPAPGPEWCPVGPRTVVVADPEHIAATGERLLLVGGSGRAVVVDTGSDDLVPVAAGMVPKSLTGYRLSDDGVTVEVAQADSIWRVPLPPLPQLDELAQFAEAAAGALVDSSDLDQVNLGASLTRSDGEAIDEAAADMALGSDARCYLAANAVIEAWKAEAGQGVAGARLSAARTEAQEQCIGNSPLAEVGRRLAAASHFIAPGTDPWPEEWSLLLNDAIAGNRLASRAILIGLANSADVFARSAGDWFVGSRAAIGLEFPDSVLQDASAALALDPALRAVVEAQRESYEPAIHEILGHIAANSRDAKRAREAWVHFRIAEMLYRNQFGREAEADRTAQIRARLSRMLSPAELLGAWEEAASWTAGIEAVAMAEAPPTDLSLRERMRADAERIAGSEAENIDDDAPYRVLQAYLWLNLADIELGEAPAEAVGSYSRFVDIVATLPSDALPPLALSAFAEAWLRLVELGSASGVTGTAAAIGLAPFILDLAETGNVPTWDAPTLRNYALIVDAVARALRDNPAALTPAMLAGFAFSERRFDHTLRVEGDEVHEAATTAFEARRALLDLLIDRDTSRSDWLAARGTTEFWIGYRLHDTDAGRTEWLGAAIRDLSAARAAAGDAFPPESLYWLTEARRWLPTGDDPAAYFDLVADGIAEYEMLYEADELGAWDSSIVPAELMASNAELLARIADAKALTVVDRLDDWSPSDPAMQDAVLDGLFYIAEWDRTRRAARDLGSTWTSMAPGYSLAPGYLLSAVAGHLQLDGVSGDDCDRASAFAGDPQRRAPAVAFETIDLQPAIAACRALWSAARDDPRLNFLLGRLLFATEDRLGIGLDMLVTASAGEYAAAFNVLGLYLEDSGLDTADREKLNLDLRHGYAQRVVLDAFDATHTWLAPLAVTVRHAEGLRWLVERAATLGSAEAHVAAADLPGTAEADRYYHLEVAAMMYEDAGDFARVEELRGRIPPQHYVDAADRAEDEFRAERLVYVPSGLTDLIRGATN